MITTLLRREGDGLGDMHMIINAVLKQVKNLRSQITRKALNCMTDIFECASRSAESVSNEVNFTTVVKSCQTGHNRYKRYCPLL